MSHPIDLSLFKEKIKPEGKQPLNKSAYRMDGTESPRMAECAGLGTPSSCDYLYIKGKNASLIEDTNLGEKLKTIQFKVKDLENKQKENKLFRAKTILMQKYNLKIYGSLLILCRLSQKHKLVTKELQNIDFYDFFLVINDEDNIKAIDTEEIKGILDFLKEKLRESLTGQLKGGAQLINKVKVLFVEQLEENL